MNVMTVQHGLDYPITAVIRALAKLSPKQLAMYPEYQRPTERLARHFGVKPKELLLSNGGVLESALGSLIRWYNHAAALAGQRRFERPVLPTSEP